MTISSWKNHLLQMQTLDESPVIELFGSVNVLRPQGKFGDNHLSRKIEMTRE